MRLNEPHQIGAALVETAKRRHRLNCKGRRREKVFGPGRAIPLDANQKRRIYAFAECYTASRRTKGQHRGPLTRAYLDVLRALLWKFHNEHTGLCFPSWDRIAKAAKVSRDTVGQAIIALENAGILTWQHRLVRQRVRVPGLFGMVDTFVPRRNSNAYRFRDPPPPALPFDPKSENPVETGSTCESNKKSKRIAPLSDLSHRLIRSGIGRSPDDVR